ncbi:MFS transporter [Paracoccaceae bacterium GXU_MW_L88]
MALDMTERRPGVAIFWLAAAAFALGTAEFAAMGLLPYYAAGLEVSETEAGHAVSAYALGVVIGAPLLALFGAKFSRKSFILALIAVFVVGNILTTLAPTMNMLIAARFLTGLPHAGVLGISTLYAAEMMGKGKRAQAVSQVLLGLTTANIIGVPAASALGQVFGWRFCFLSVAIMGAVSLYMIWKTGPNDTRHPEASPLRELEALKNRSVWLPLAMGAIGFGGMFATYSYLSATLLQHAAAPEWSVAIVLAMFGIGSTVGNLVSGRISSGRLIASAGGFQLFMVIACALYTQLIGSWQALALAIFLIGFSGGMVVPLQTRLMDVAGDAQTMAAAMNHAAFNLANALGPFLAGAALAAGWGWGAPGWVGVALGVAGLGVWLLMALDDRRLART